MERLTTVTWRPLLRPASRPASASDEGAQDQFSPQQEVLTYRLKRKALVGNVSLSDWVHLSGEVKGAEKELDIALRQDNPQERGGLLEALTSLAQHPPSQNGPRLVAHLAHHGAQRGAQAVTHSCLETLGQWLEQGLVEVSPVEAWQEKVVEHRAYVKGNSVQLGRPRPQREEAAAFSHYISVPAGRRATDVGVERFIKLNQEEPERAAAILEGALAQDPLHIDENNLKRFTVLAKAAHKEASLKPLLEPYLTMVEELADDSQAQGLLVEGYGGDGPAWVVHAYEAMGDLFPELIDETLTRKPGFRELMWESLSQGHHGYRLLEKWWEKKPELVEPTLRMFTDESPVRWLDWNHVLFRKAATDYGWQPDPQQLDWMASQISVVDGEKSPGYEPFLRVLASLRQRDPAGCQDLQVAVEQELVPLSGVASQWLENLWTRLESQRGDPLATGGSRLLFQLAVLGGREEELKEHLRQAFRGEDAPRSKLAVGALRDSPNENVRKMVEGCLAEEWGEEAIPLIGWSLPADLFGKSLSLAPLASQIAAGELSSEVVSALDEVVSACRQHDQKDLFRIDDRLSEAGKFRRQLLEQCTLGPVELDAEQAFAVVAFLAKRYALAPESPGFASIQAQMVEVLDPLLETYSLLPESQRLDCFDEDLQRIFVNRPPQLSASHVATRLATFRKVLSPQHPYSTGYAALEATVALDVPYDQDFEALATALKTRPASWPEMESSLKAIVDSVLSEGQNLGETAGRFSQLLLEGADHQTARRLLNRPEPGHWIKSDDEILDINGVEIEIAS